MKCPHCQVAVNEAWSAMNLGGDSEHVALALRYMNCPDCGRKIIDMQRQPNGTNVTYTIPLYPRHASTRQVPREVEDPYATDYREAAEALAISPKASAALSRRILQTVLREAAGVKHADLSVEIDEVLGRRTLPSQLAEAIDAVRQIGNFAAHPIKSKTSGAVVEVEPGEAEWLLDVLDAAFDFYFVQPAILRKKRDALNLKLKETGKPPLK